MEKNILSVNQKLTLNIKSGNYKGKYSSRIEDIQENSIAIASPIYEGALIPVNPGMTIEITAITDNALYSFNSLVLEKRESPIPMLIVMKPDKIQKLQRRSFFRIKVNLPILYRILPSLTSPSYEEFSSTTCKDISGGGLLLLLTKELPKDTLLELIIKIPKIENINAVGRVVFVKNSATEKNMKETAIEFVIIEEKDRERIIKFIFDQQREQIRKEARAGK